MWLVAGDSFPGMDDKGQMKRCKHLGVWTGLAAFCALLGILLPACSQKGEANRILELIEEGASRAETRDLQGLIELTTEDFVALPGNHDRDQAKEILAAAFFHYRRFRIHYPEPSIQLSEDGGTARTRIHFLIVREERSYPGLDELYRDPQGWLERVGENADLYQLELDVVKETESWFVRAARLGSFKEVGFLP